MPFTFLGDLQQKFSSAGQSSAASSSPPAYALQRTFGPTIANLMNQYNTSPPTDELTRAQSELAQVKDIMVQNVEQILSRGERIELLVDKTDNMASQAAGLPVVEEGKLLSESLSTVKIQVQQMRRYLVRA